MAKPPSGPGFSEQAPASGPSVAVDGGYLTPYRVQLPGSEVTFEMIPVPAGVVQLGLPEGVSTPEEEGFAFSPSIRVQVEPFWIGRCEVTWAEYWRFMELDKSFAVLKQLREKVKAKDAIAVPLLKKQPTLWERVRKSPKLVDGVTAPTPLYDPDVTYESGEEPNLPAATMTQYAARQYTKWLSLAIGVDYRLPTEAEWEHAARAGGDGAVADVSAVAWHDENADYVTHPVGTLKPNAWGLHDMLGNVAELVLDDPNGKITVDGNQPIPAAKAVVWPIRTTPLMAKGGYWDAGAALCTPASRMLTDDEYWKGSDPNLPKSPWWFADYPSHGVGFRLLRPYQPMDKRTRQLAWEINNDDLQTDVDHRLEEGRGKLGTIDTDLPKALEQAKSEAISELLE